MTDKEMILLNSCVRFTIVECLSKADFAAEDLAAIIENVSNGIFNNGDRKDVNIEVIKDLQSLLKKIEQCQKAFCRSVSK